MLFTYDKSSTIKFARHPFPFRLSPACALLHSQTAPKAPSTRLGIDCEGEGDEFENGERQTDNGREKGMLIEREMTIEKGVYGNEYRCRNRKREG